MRVYQLALNYALGFVGLFATSWIAFDLIGRPAFAEEPSSAGNATLFDRLDANHDSHLVADEIPTEHQRLFARLIRRADENADHALDRDEFFAALVPSRPKKTLETKQTAKSPQASTVRYLLLSMDTDGNSAIVADEVPEALRSAFEAMLERVDRNENEMLERIELVRAGPQLARIAARYSVREGVDVSRELRKLEETLGASANRFDAKPPPADYLNNPQQARQLFRRLDRNEDGRLTSRELPERLQGRLGPLFRRGDRNRDGQISEREFVVAAQRLAGRLKRRQTMEMPNNR